jgi:hypothetical protein
MYFFNVLNSFRAEVIPNIVCIWVHTSKEIDRIPISKISRVCSQRKERAGFLLNPNNRHGFNLRTKYRILKQESSSTYSSNSDLMSS